ncbi:MAG: hypothetical protein GEU75_13305 [Dehalococcoidia bacterium]|nr:hypothetical protein [Dehalococcoidia bacterium]
MTHGRSKHDDVLTPRERQVLDLITEGLTNEQIAEKLGISPNTAKFHVSEIISKLGVSSRHEAVEVMRVRSHRQRLPAWFAFPLCRAQLAVGISVLVVSLMALLIVTSPWPNGSSRPSAVATEANNSVGLDLPPATATTMPVGYTDPFEYCAAVGRVDEPDGRYVGPMFSAGLVEGFARALGRDPRTGPSFVWRCADGRVMACTHGNNLHCGKADTNREPTAQMIEYCLNPSQDLPEGLPPDLLRFIPRTLIPNRNATVYSWECRNGLPEAVPSQAVDAHGFIERLWYVVSNAP